MIKPTAAEPRLLKHTGPALVFDNYDEMSKAVNDDDLDVTPDHVMVLRNAGPVGGPGMPEWGMLPIPKKLLKQGVRDMVRISDARMSGTSYGACILHVAPEACIGGPLAAVRTGDLITVDVAARSIHLNRRTPRSRAGSRLRRRSRGPRPARLLTAYAAAHHAGRQGLRLRLPGRARAASRSRRSTEARGAPASSVLFAPHFPALSPSSLIRPGIKAHSRQARSRLSAALRPG